VERDKKRDVGVTPVEGVQDGVGEGRRSNQDKQEQDGDAQANGRGGARTTLLAREVMGEEADPANAPLCIIQCPPNDAAAAGDDVKLLTISIGTRKAGDTTYPALRGEWAVQDA